MHLTCSCIFHFLNLQPTVSFQFFSQQFRVWTSDICRNKIPNPHYKIFLQQSQMLHSIKYDWTEIASCGIHFDFDQCTFRGQKEMATHTIRTVKSFQNISHLLTPRISDCWPLWDDSCQASQQLSKLDWDKPMW